MVPRRLVRRETWDWDEYKPELFHLAYFIYDIHQGREAFLVVDSSLDLKSKRRPSSRSNKYLGRKWEPCTYLFVDGC